MSVPIIAKSSGFYQLSEPMSLRQAKDIVVPGLRLLVGIIASVEIVPTAKRSSEAPPKRELVRVRFSYTPSHLKELDLRRQWLEGETTKALREGGSYIWSRQMSLDRSALRAECRNPSTGGRYYITLRGGRYTCTCPRFATSGKTACKHIQDAIVRKRFEALYHNAALYNTTEAFL
jgi:hypothetical protein